MEEGVLRFQGKIRSNYFLILCEKCDKHVDVEFGSNGPVPTIIAKCDSCGTGELNLKKQHWMSLQT